MKNFILLTDIFSGEKMLINLDYILSMRDSNKGTVIVSRRGVGTDICRVSETVEKIYEIINKK